MAESKIKRSYTHVTVSTPVVNIAANTTNVEITAPTVSGYKFLYWLTAVTTGGSFDALIIANNLASTTRIFRALGAQSPYFSEQIACIARAVYEPV